MGYARGLLTFTLNTSGVGSRNLDLSTLTMNWVDQDSPSGQTQAMSGMVYANIYAAPSVVVVTNPPSSISIAPGESFTMIASLRGGYNVTAQTIHAATTTAGISFSNNDCILNSLNSSCSITVHAGSNAALVSGQTVTLSNSTTPSMTLTPSTVTFAIAQNFFSFNLPSAITLNSAGTIAFIVNGGNSTITQCSVSGGTLSNCANSGATLLAGPIGIALNHAGTIAFITNGNSTITRCSVSGGTLSACVDSGVVVVHPTQIILNSTGTIAFITTSNRNKVIQCAVSDGTTLSSCVDSGADSGTIGLLGTFGITLNSEGTIAFITDMGMPGIVMQCTVSGGTLSNCANSEADTLVAPYGITLNSAGTIAFITNVSSSLVTQCTVSGGTLSNCGNSEATTLSSPNGIILNQTGDIAFITNTGDNSVTRCSVSGGILSACARTGT